MTARNKYGDRSTHAHSATFSGSGDEFDRIGRINSTEPKYPSEEASEGLIGEQFYIKLLVDHCGENCTSILNNITLHD